MKQYLVYKIKNAKEIGLNTNVRIEGRVIEIAGDRSKNIVVTIEVTDFQKIYDK